MLADDWLNNAARDAQVKKDIKKFISMSECERNKLEMINKKKHECKLSEETRDLQRSHSEYY